MAAPATAKRDYYEVLDVPRDADASVIKDAFRTLALRYHPDRNKEPGADERFREIAEAYAVLSDPAKRADYDRGGFAGLGEFSVQDLFGGLDLGDLFREMGFDLGAGFFGPFFRRGREPARGADLSLDLEVPLERLTAESEEPVRIVRPHRCDACGGSGAATGTSPRTCDTCHGTGQQTTGRREGNVVVQRVTTCRACDGRGQVIDRPCGACGGLGLVDRPETLTVKIPAGIDEGTSLRVAGKGLADPSGGPPGDLFVTVRTAPDPRFVRRGANLWRDESIEVLDAVLGTRLRVPTLQGHATLKIPPGTQPETVFRLAGKGLPRFPQPGQGDLFIRVTVHIPERLDRSQRQLYERLRAGERPGRP